MMFMIKNMEQNGCLNTLNYVDSLQSLVWINKDLKVYKLKLEKENAF